jgi:iron complex outermembrane receptor protein
VDYKFHFLPELHANLNAGYDYTKSNGKNNINPLASWSYREPEKNVVSYSQELKTSLLDFYLNYQKDLEGLASRVDITAGYSWQHFYRETSDANRPWTATEGVYLNADTVIHKNENYLVSFFGRVNYSLMDRYLLTFTLRDDGSSRFSEDNRWGLFRQLHLPGKSKMRHFWSMLIFSRI